MPRTKQPKGYFLVCQSTGYGRIQYERLVDSEVEAIAYARQFAKDYPHYMARPILIYELKKTVRVKLVPVEIEDVKLPSVKERKDGVSQVRK